MKKNILHIIAISALLLVYSMSLFSQSTIRVSVKSGPAGTPIEGAAIADRDSSQRPGGQSKPGEEHGDVRDRQDHGAGGDLGVP